MFKYTKSTEVNPQKNKRVKMVQTFSLLWDSIPKRKSLASVESGMERKKKKCGIVYPLATVIRGSNAMSLIIQTASNCVPLKATEVRTNLQIDAATNPQFKEEKTL